MKTSRVVQVTVKVPDEFMAFERADLAHAMVDAIRGWDDIEEIQVSS